MMGFLNETNGVAGKKIYTSAEDDGLGKPVTPVKLWGNNVTEQLTQVNAVGGTLTFSKNIRSVGIYNRDLTNDGVFNINGINIHVPKGESVDFSVGGTPRATITITGSTLYIVTRYE